MSMYVSVKERGVISQAPLTLFLIILIFFFKIFKSLSNLELPG